jgi:hypothetical protein
MFICIMPTKKKYTYKQKTSKKKQYNKKKRTIKKRHTRKKTRYGGSFSKWFTDRKKKRILKKWRDDADIKVFTPVLKKDIDFMLEATRFKQEAWGHAHKTLREDRDFTLKAIEKNTRALQYIHENFKKDKDVVISAVEKRGTDLQYAHDDMKKDPDVVTAAVKNDGQAIRFASVGLIRNEDFLVELLKLYWDGEIKYPDPPVQGGFSLSDKNHPKYDGYIDEKFNLFFLYIIYIKDNEGNPVLEDEGERMKKLRKDFKDTYNSKSNASENMNNSNNKKNRKTNLNDTKHGNSTIKNSVHNPLHLHPNKK